MKVLGLILELNPFHNGHNYFIKSSINEVKPDYTVAVISPSFMMRGDVMVQDKFTRTRLLLESGIDVVCELPSAYCLNNADVFAREAINILKGFNITDLSFGVENNDLNQLNQIVDVMDTLEYQNLMKNYLDKGFSYPNSSYKSIYQLTNNQDLSYASTLPNNTLAIQYLRNIRNTNIKANLITRINNNYYDQTLQEGPIQSATSLRKMMELNQQIKNYLPNTSISYQLIDINKTYDNLFKLIKYKFQIEDISLFSSIINVSEGIENRISSMLDKVNSFPELVENVQTKRYPPNRIKRTLISILIDANKEKITSSLSYYRVLGLSNSGEKLINKLDKEFKKQIITSLKNNDNEIAKIELRATRLYDIITEQNTLINEFKVPIKETKNDN